MEKEWNRSVSEHVEATAPPGSGLCDSTRQNIPAHPPHGMCRQQHRIWNLGFVTTAAEHAQAHCLATGI